VTDVFWHARDGVGLFDERLPTLKRGVANSVDNLQHRAVWFSDVYGQPVSYFPRDLRAPRNGKLVAIYRRARYRPLNE
jgi:hypothetical protein